MVKRFAATAVAAVAAGGVMMMSAPAFAAGGGGTSGAHGVLSGNQIIIPITAPINVCGNAVAVIGAAGAGCEGGASVGGHH